MIGLLLNMKKNDKCKYCHEPLEYELVDNNVYSNITANRINNMIGHEIDNCEICCIDCNRKIKNIDNTSDFL